MTRLGCLGYGAWGRNVVRVAATTPDAELVAVAEPDPARAARLRARHPGVEHHGSHAELLARDDVDAVLVATQAATHAELVVQAARAGKHVLVEKPLALDAESARAAVDAARDAGVRLQVGHLLRYHPAVEVLLDVARRELGAIRCVAAQRLNFGSVRSDENVLFSLGPHDLSLMLELFGEAPETVSAHGGCFVREGIEDLAFVTLRFPGGGLGSLHLSWLDPHKTRRLTVVGERNMAIFDDMEPREKVRVYDQGVDRPEGEAWVYGENLALRRGDIRVPRFAPTEPLAVEVAEFVRCVREDREPRTPGEEGLRVVRILEAAQRSARGGGAPVALGSEAAGRDRPVIA